MPPCSSHPSIVSSEAVISSEDISGHRVGDVFALGIEAVIFCAITKEQVLTASIPNAKTSPTR